MSTHVDTTQPGKVLEVLQLKRQLEALKEFNRLREDNGLEFFRPHWKQHLFLSHADRKYRYARTGNRFGKSDMGAAEDVAWAYGERSWYKHTFDVEGAGGKVMHRHEGHENHPLVGLGIPKRPTKGVVLTVDWQKSQEIFTNLEAGLGRGKLFKFLPRDAFRKASKSSNGVIDKLTVESIHGGESSIYFDTVKSFMQNPMGLESSNWDWVHVDEPIPQEMWKAVSRGLVDTGGSAWFCCTPLSEPWLNDFFLPNVMYQLDETAANVFGEKGNKIVVTGSMYDNPYVNDDDKRDYEETLTEDEKKCRIHGIPLAMAGMVYKEFDHTRHIYREVPHGWESKGRPPENYTIYRAIDPHPRTPHAVLWIAVAPTGEKFVFDEIFDGCLIPELSEQILRVEDGLFFFKGVTDPLAYIKNPVDDTCMADCFFEHGVFFEKSSKERERGILMTRELLAEPSGFYVNEDCVRTIWEFEHYVWDPNRPDKPLDKDDHMMENLYRLAITELEFVDEDYNSKEYYPQVSLASIEQELDRRVSLEV